MDYNIAAQALAVENFTKVSADVEGLVAAARGDGLDHHAVRTLLSTPEHVSAALDARSMDLAGKLRQRDLLRVGTPVPAGADGNLWDTIKRKYQNAAARANVHADHYINVPKLEGNRFYRDTDNWLRSKVRFGAKPVMAAGAAGLGVAGLASLASILGSEKRHQRRAERDERAAYDVLPRGA